MNIIPLTSVGILPNRQRQEFAPEALQELKNSIEDTGLLHPPVLRQIDGGFVLVAGERRLKAISEIFALGGGFTYNRQRFTAEKGLIPFTDLGDLSELEAEEAELDENLKRKDLTWQEHAAAVERLHNLRVKQAKASFDKNLEEGVVKGNILPIPHTIADTAKELTGRSDGSYQDNVRKEIIVARHLDNPVIAKAKSADEAFKLLKKDEERKKNVELAATIGASFNSDIHELHNISCLDWMAKPEAAGRFDVICTDPPYGMGAQDFGDAGGKMTAIEHHYDDSYESWKQLMTDWAPLTMLVTKPEAHLYAFCDLDNYHELKRILQAVGWYVFRTPLILHKINSGRVPLPDRGPRRQWEMILYAIKGNKPVTHIYPDVVAATGDENMSHGAQKPVAVIQNLLQRSVRPGDEVLDCFAGTGPIFPAAHTYKCKAVGLELNPEYFALSAKRLKEVKENDSLGLF